MQTALLQLLQPHRNFCQGLLQPRALFFRQFQPRPLVGIVGVAGSLPMANLTANLGSLRDALVWSPGNIEHWMEQGERDAMHALTSVRM